RCAFGAAFLRATRFTFLRSILSVMLLVFAMNTAFLCDLGFEGGRFLTLGRPDRAACNPSPECPVSYAFSSWAYFSTSFFKPNFVNCTVIFAFSPSPSRWYTIPSPYFGWRTRCPGRNPPRLAVSVGSIFGRVNFFPRDAKKSAMLPIELYDVPRYELCGFVLGCPYCGRWSSSSYE